jgi:hypothetical protein
MESSDILLPFFFQSQSVLYCQEPRNTEPPKREIRLAISLKKKQGDELIDTHDTTTSLIALGVMASHLLDDGTDAGNQ